MIVDALRPGDHARWTELWTGYLRFYEATLPPETHAFTWSRLMAGGPVHGLAAREDGRMVGIVHYLFHPSCWTMSDVCYLQDLFVDDAARGGGVGRALIEAVADQARARGAAKLYWMTQDHNATARQLYDRLARHAGFIRYDYKPL